MGRYQVSAARRYQLGETGPVESALQAVALLLATPKGTIPMYRDFGISTEALDLPRPAAKARLMIEISEALARYEPRAVLERVTFEGDGLDGVLRPVVEVSV